MKSSRMKSSLLKQIKQKEHCIRFHMPGHSGKSPNQEYAELYSNAKFDITELPYSDNLLNSTDLLKDLQKRIAMLYQAQHAFIFTNGATGALFCAIFSAHSFADNILILGGAHKSVYNAIRLSGGNAWQAPGNWDIDTLAKQIKETNIGTLILTSPNYQGQTIDKDYLQAIKRLFPKLQVIVDAAHGAHFVFSDKLTDKRPIGADLIVYSLHKTLPVFTGGAILLSTAKYAEKIQFYRSMLHSTSPSYPIILSIECAIDFYSKKGERIYQDIFQAVQDCKSALPVGFKAVENADFSRLVLSCQDYNCMDVYNALAEQGIYAEAADRDRIIFIVTQNNYTALPILCNALAAIVVSLPLKGKPIENCPLPQDIFLLKFAKDFELKEPKDCIGKTCYSELGLYPPGTPFLFSGQKITKSHVNFILEHHSALFGLVNGKVCVVK